MIIANPANTMPTTAKIAPAENSRNRRSTFPENWYSTPVSAMTSNNTTGYFSQAHSGKNVSVRVSIAASAPVTWATGAYTASLIVAFTPYEASAATTITTSFSVAASMVAYHRTIEPPSPPPWILFILRENACTYADADHRAT